MRVLLLGWVPGPAELLLGCGCLLPWLAAYVVLFVWVLADIKARVPVNTVPLWVLVIVLTGPVGLVAWLICRPGRAGPRND